MDENTTFTTLFDRKAPTLVDLTPPMRPGMPVWPTHPPFRSEIAESYERGDVALNHALCMSEHSGTHFCSFFEDRHLDGATDMVAVIAAILDEERRRRVEGRSDQVIPMRPDHGQEILDDLARGAQPGYPAIGRLKGLAELRGVERALSHPSHGLARQ